MEDDDHDRDQADRAQGPTYDGKRGSSRFAELRSSRMTLRCEPVLEVEERPLQGEPRDAREDESQPDLERHDPEIRFDPDSSSCGAALRARGVRTWFSHNDLDAGKKIHEGIFTAIDSFDRLIVVLSQHSIGSQWVKTELHRAFSRQRKEGRNVLFPVSLVPFSILQGWTSFDADSGKDLAVELREYLIPALGDPTSEDEFSRFVDAIVKGLAATGDA